jgi:hypothetical protein
MFAYNPLDVLEAQPPQLYKCTVADAVTNALGPIYRHIFFIFLIDLLDLAGFNVHLISTVGDFVADQLYITLYPRVNVVRLLATRRK